MKETRRKTTTPTSSLKKKIQKIKNYPHNPTASSQPHYSKTTSTSTSSTGPIQDTSPSLYNPLSTCGPAAPPESQEFISSEDRETLSAV
jgi:hypothetical protein